MRVVFSCILFIVINIKPDEDMKMFIRVVGNLSTSDTVVMNKLIEESLERMKENGLKHTKKREDLIRLFSKEDRYLTAKTVQQMLEKIYPSISFDTVYRNLYVD